MSNIAPKITAKSDEFLLQYIQNTLPSQHNLNLVVGLISLSGTHVLYLDVLNIIGGLLIRAVVVSMYCYMLIFNERSPKSSCDSYRLINA